MENTTMSASARSYLFVPADQIERLPKALATAADVVVVDLEDAVAPDAKERARAAFTAAQFPRDRVTARINGSGTKWLEADIDAIKALGVRDIMLPKSEDPEEIAVVADRLGHAVADLPIIKRAARIVALADRVTAPC